MMSDLKVGWVLVVFVVCGVQVQGDTVFIDGKRSIARIDENFICATLDWWPPDKCDYGTCSWGHASLLNLDLKKPVFINAIKAFSGLKIRVGGTLQDKVEYQTEDKPCVPFAKDSSIMFGFTKGCLPLQRWDELNTFFNQTGWVGNELSGTGIGVGIAADQYASDTILLHHLIHHDIYRRNDIKPLIIAPGGFFDALWFQEFLAQTVGSLNVITHHIYNLGPGSDEHLIHRILDPSVLDNGANVFRNLHNIVRTSPNTASAWVGESGGAYNSGRNGVTNAFVFSFWYLDQLGRSSTFDTKTYCRQTLIGGNYGLLNTTTFIPNPDYYSALLWHRLMGRRVLSTNFNGTRKLRAYAHCAKHSQGITLLLINIDENTTFEARVDFNGTLLTRHKHHYHRHRPSLTRLHHRKQALKTAREEYHLTPMDGNIQSQTVLLNGKALLIDSSGLIPALEPVTVNSSEPIRVAPYSIVFVSMPSVVIPACT
ncbi:hypothetical protein ACS0TY_021223 [Phlomoides rotata]